MTEKLQAQQRNSNAKIEREWNGTIHIIGSNRNMCAICIPTHTHAFQKILHPRINLSIFRHKNKYFKAQKPNAINIHWTFCEREKLLGRSGGKFVILWFGKIIKLRTVFSFAIFFPCPCVVSVCHSYKSFLKWTRAFCYCWYVLYSLDRMQTWIRTGKW